MGSPPVGVDGLDQRDAGRVMADLIPPPVVPDVKSRKALAAAIVNGAGALGLAVTNGTAQEVAFGVLFVVNVYAVWRTPNPPKERGRRAR